MNTEWQDDIPEPEQGPNGAQMEPLTFRRPSEILAMFFDDSDFILKNGYIAKGDPFAFCGAAGIGKSRLILQLLIAIITGRDFLGWPTNGKGTHWLLLQSENVNRRLKSDLWAMVSGLTAEEKALVDECLFIHTLETGDDSFLHLNVPENQERIAAATGLRRWTGVIFDVLRDYAVDDLSADQGMQETLAVISRLCRKNNPDCIIGIMHHARTGKAGAASATGFDRSSFGRNSKVLLSWVRSQINVAPYEGDNNEVIVISSAKCNNAPEFAPFAARLNKKTLMYERDEEADIGEWEELVGNTRPRPKVKKTKEDLLALVPDPSDISKNSLLIKAGEAGIGEKKARGFIDDLRDAGQLFEYAHKRSGLRDDIRLSRYAPAPAAGAVGNRGNNKRGKRVSGKR